MSGWPINMTPGCSCRIESEISSFRNGSDGSSKVVVCASKFPAIGKEGIVGKSWIPAVGRNREDSNCSCAGIRSPTEKKRGSSSSLWSDNDGHRFRVDGNVGGFHGALAKE
jgi:hypothetical protein